MSKLAKYRKKLGCDVLKDETDYRVLKKIYIEGGNIRDEIIKGTDSSSASVINKKHEKILKAKKVTYIGDDVLIIFCERVINFGPKDNIYLLEQRHALVTQVNTSGKTALHVAVLRNEIHLASYLIKKRAMVNAQDNKGNSPLHIAANNKNLEICKLLVDNGADVQKENGAMKDPVMISLDGGDCEIFNLFFGKIDINKTNYLDYMISNTRGNVNCIDPISFMVKGKKYIQEKGNFIRINMLSYCLRKAIEFVSDKDKFTFLAALFSKMMEWEDSGEIFRAQRDNLIEKVNHISESCSFQEQVKIIKKAIREK